MPPPGPPPAAAAPPPPAAPRSAAARSFLANLPIPLALVALALAGRYVVTPENVRAARLDYPVGVMMLAGVTMILAVSLQLINGFAGQFSLGHAGFMAVGAYLSAYPSVAYSRDAADGSRELFDPGSVLLYYLALLASVGLAAALLAGLFAAARSSKRLHPSLPAVLMLALFVWVVVDVWRAARAAGPPPAWLVFTHAIRLLTRLFDGVLAAGGPAAAAASRALPAAAAGPACFVVLLAGGGLCAAAVGLVVGLPALRLRGDYLAVATLGFAEIIRIVITNARPLGGALGMRDVPTYTTFAWLYGAVVVTIVVVGRLAYSARGRAIGAVREDEIAAAAVGVSPIRQKVLSFVVGAFFAGVGGALYAHYTGFITPGDFGFVQSVEFVVIVTLGGLASLSGTILATIVLTLLLELLRNADAVMPDAIRRTGLRLADWRMVLYALLLIGMMLLRPQGLLGGKELWRRRRRTAATPRDTASPGMAGG